MNRAIATDQQHLRKRVRFDPTATLPPSSTVNSTMMNNTDTTDNSTTTSPSLVAKEYLRNHVASLHEQVAGILETLGRQQLQLLVKAYNKKKQVSRMEDDADFIPRSARVNFAFHMSDEAAHFCHRSI